MANNGSSVHNKWYQSGPVLGGQDVTGKSSKVSENGKVQNEPVESRLNRIEMGVKETYRKLEAGLLVGDETWRKNLITKLEWMKKEIEEIRREAEGDADEGEVKEEGVKEVGFEGAVEDVGFEVGGVAGGEVSRVDSRVLMEEEGNPTLNNQETTVVKVVMQNQKEKIEEKEEKMRDIEIRGYGTYLERFHGAPAMMGKNGVATTRG